MKRTISIVLLLLCVLLTSAQIQRNILGFTLGKTTKAQVISNLNLNNSEYDANPNDYIIVYNTLFFNHNWAITLLRFYNNILYSVEFSADERNTPEDVLDTLRYNLYLGLNEKYQQYCIFNDFESADDFCQAYKDAYMQLIYSCTSTVDGCSLLLSYDYLPMMRKKAKQDNSDL